MTDYLDTIIYTGVIALIFCGIFAFSMFRDRSRYRNTILLIFAGMSFLLFLLSFAGKFANTISLVLFLIVVLLLMAFPVFLIANGIVMMKREGHALANLLALLLGIVLLIGELALFLWSFLIWIAPQIGLESVSEMLAGRGAPLLVFLWVSAAYITAVFVSFMLYCMFLQLLPHRRDFDYVVIHGAGLRKDGTVTKLLAGRCDKAIQIYRKDATKPILIPSGGKGNDEVQSEAEAMADYLISKGIPEEHILLESSSATTMQNLQNSRELIESRPGRKYTALVTSNYHVYRAMRYAKRIGLNAVGIGAHVAPYYWPSALIREFIAIHREKKHLILFLLGYVLVLLPWILFLLY
jgi:uncharacterized SAM-binding protein YcdF (DUF218 family)